jgi:mRNA-degrading endonuclease RelE of RelBE toxin-antitoxin system
VSVPTIKRLEAQDGPLDGCNETTNGSGNVKRLKGTRGCRLRIGDWRVIFIEDARSITVIAVGNRREIYD